jgi:hypothetical protein
MSEVKGSISDFAQEVEQGQKENAIADPALGIRYSIYDTYTTSACRQQSL